MAKVRTHEDKISPAGTFSGNWVTKIEDKEAPSEKDGDSLRKSTRECGGRLRHEEAR